MSFDYDKLVDKEEDPNWWTSFSDLWSMLSVVFLLLFVVTSLRNGTQGARAQIEMQEVTQKNEELQEQLRVYSNLREETLDSTSEQEQATYKKLMSKLTLLQDEARGEKNELQKQAKENEEKEEALNQYQQIVRNIIDSNVLAKAQIKRRDLDINEKKKTIQQLNRETQRKEAAIAKNEGEIEKIESQLAQNIKTLQKEQANATVSRHAAYQQIDRMKKESEKRVSALQSLNSASRSEMNRRLAEAREGFSSELEATKTGYSDKLEEVKKGFGSELEATKKGFSAQLGKAQEQNAQLGGQLAEANEKLNAKNKLIGQLQNNFSKAGVRAKVDKGTGDVMIDFGEEYFETGSSNMKPRMVSTLNQLIPNYTKSIFQDAKVADQIASIEIIGFASSTYKGKYVNPSSLKPENQAAINYNLRLSFSRANSIFKHIFDPAKLSYPNQKKLLPLVKVVGRGFLPEGRNIAQELPEQMPESQFCAKYNCKKAQRVIIKFNLKD